MEPTMLTTERLLLRPVVPADAEAVHAACQDPDIQRWVTVPSPYLPEHAESFVGQTSPDGWRDGSMFNFGVFLREDGRLAAMTGVTRRIDATAEIGYWAVKEHRGRGYVVEAVRALAHWAFRRAGVSRLEWRAEVGNAASRAVAEKAGFTIEGVLRAAVLNKGTVRDSWVGALLPSDVGLMPVHPYLPAKH